MKNKGLVFGVSLVLFVFLAKRFFYSGGNSNVVTLVENIGADVVLNPHLIDTSESFRVFGDIYEGLVDYSVDSELRLTGAKRYEISEDCKTYTFYLVEEARWANGDPVTADDYVFSLRRAVNPSTLAGAYLSNLYDIRNAKRIVNGEMDCSELGVYAKDKYVLVFELENANFEFLHYLTLPIFVPMHRPTVERCGLKSFSDIDSVMSNGPYKVVSWVRNSFIELVKSDNYWDKKNVGNVERVKFLMIEDGVSDLNLFRSKGEHITHVNIPMIEESDYIKEFGDMYKKTNVLCQLRLVLNLDCDKFKDINVRKALNIALDRDSINGAVLKGATSSYSIIHEQVYGGEFKDEVKRFKDYDWVNLDMNSRKKLAVELIKKAGYSVKKPLKISILSSNDALFRDTTTAIQDNFKSMFDGLVVCEITLLDRRTFLYRMDKRDFEILNCRWIADYNLPSNYSMLYTGSLNYSGYKNDEFKKMYCDSLKSNSMSLYLSRQHLCSEIAAGDYVAIPYSLMYFRRIVSSRVSGYHSDRNVLGRHSTKYINITN